MKAKALTIHWHLDNQPIYSADFQNVLDGDNSIQRLATAGGDNNVRIWQIIYDEVDSHLVNKVRYLSTLSKHTQAVNVVRFDPKGNVLASAGDDGTILLWVLSDQITREFGADSELDDKETWKLRHACRSSVSEVYDIAWSPDSQYIIAGSMDNIARIYNATNGQCIRQLAEHLHYVQGVAWDPLNEYIATQSSDRSVHIYTLKTKNGQFSLSNPHKISRAELPSRRITSSPAPERIRRDSNENHPLSPIANNASSPTAIAPGTPRISFMNPPPPTSRGHSRKSSFSSANRSESPSPAMPLPAVRQLGSPSLGTATLATSGSSSSTTTSASTTTQNSANCNTVISSSSSTSTSTSTTTATSSSSSSSSSSFITTSSTNTNNTNTNPNTNSNMTSQVNNTTVTKLSVLYHNEAFTSFFRRLTFTPDGSLLLTPSGLFKYLNNASSSSVSNDQEMEETTNTVYIYTRAGLNRPPVAHLPGLKKPSLAVKCSPVLYKLREPPEARPTKHVNIDTKNAKDCELSNTVSILPQSSTNGGSYGSHDDLNSPVFKLQYRIIYAVATQDSVIVYDTQHKTPLCIVSNLHYATFTDLTWSPDGRTLFMTSTDGFCSVITFEQGELGEKYEKPAAITASSSLSPRISVTTSLSANTSIGEPSSPASDPLIPIISNVPPVVYGGSSSLSSLSTPPGTPSSRQATLETFTKEDSKKREGDKDSEIKKKRRIAPTLISSDKNT